MSSGTPRALFTGDPCLLQHPMQLHLNFKPVNATSSIIDNNWLLDDILKTLSSTQSASQTLGQQLIQQPCNKKKGEVHIWQTEL